MTTPPAAVGVTPSTIDAYVLDAWPGYTRMSRCVEVSGAHATVERMVEAHEMRPGEVISGPTQFAIADAALWFAVMGAAGFDAARSVTSELSIRYLRPGIGTTLLARADLASVGSRTFVGSVLIWTSDATRPVSTAQGTYVLPRS